MTRKQALKVKTRNVIRAMEDTYAWVQDIANTPAVKQVVTIGSQVIDAVIPFIEKPSPWHGLQTSFNVGKALTTAMLIDADEFFAGDEWLLAYNHDFSWLLVNVLQKFPKRVMKTKEDTYVIVLIDLAKNVTVGYSMNVKANIPSAVYVVNDQAVEARAILKKLLWAHFGNKPLVMKAKSRHFHSTGPTTMFEEDNTFEPLPSEKATEHTRYLAKCIEKGVNRSLLLYGPPGTGKSTMARTLVNNLGLKSFRIRIEDVSSLESSVLFEAIHIFEPDAVILDDFDRARGQAALLEVMEFFRHRVKLVIATINDRNELDEALMRPGRFDELIEIDKMDDDVVKSVLGEEHADVFDNVKDWPVAFIVEYVERCKFMSKEDAIKATEELSARVERLMEYRTRSDIERMQALLADEPEKGRRRRRS